MSDPNTNPVEPEEADVQGAPDEKPLEVNGGGR